MGWTHTATAPPPSTGIAFSSGNSRSHSHSHGHNNGGSAARSTSSMYTSYGGASGYPSMATTAENVGLAAMGRTTDSASATAYRMTPSLQALPPPPSPSSPSTTSSSSPLMYPVQTSPHDYNHHLRNPYGYIDCRTAAVAAAAAAANMPQSSSSSLYMAHNEYPPMTANSNRMMRNLAEKMRRDKLNTYINELSTLVPMVSNSPKKMDKTSVLRLATTYLRIHRVTEATRDQRNVLPQILSSSEWPQTLLDKMDGVMLIVTSAGKIVFISHNIEKVLGHTQTELMGHGLSNITFPPDLPELRRCLTPDKEDENCSDNTNANNCTLVERQRRSFCLRLRHRCLARSEQPQYEPMHLNGFLRVPKKYTCQAQKKSRKCKGEMTATNSNEILLVAVMKPAREMTLMSIVEASQEEYVTRHWYDGRIVFCDQRISLVSGYLPEEVKGLQALQFMAKEEVHWVMIALRQMLWNREGFGKSCYRLKRKNGDFIYMVTHGYLEPCEDLQKSTFVCVNTLVSSEEGLREIRNMKKKFTPIIERRDEPAIAAIAEKYAFVRMQGRNVPDLNPTTEDPDELKNALKAMVTNIPPPIEVKEDPEQCRETQFAKVKYISKTLPPPTIPTGKVITVMDEKTASPTSPAPSTSSKRDRLSPLPVSTSAAYGTTATNSASMGSPSPSPSPSPSSSSSQCQHAVVSPSSMAALSPCGAALSRTSFQNRPSVLRIAPARQAVNSVSATVADNYAISSTSNFDGDKATNDDAGRKYSASFCGSPAAAAVAGTGSVRRGSTNCDFIKQECAIKQEAVDVDNYNDDGCGVDDDDDDADADADDDDLEAQIAAVIQTDSGQQLVAAMAAAQAMPRVGVVVSGRSALKRRLDCDASSFASSIVPIKKNAHCADGVAKARHQKHLLAATAVPSPLPLPPSHQVSSSSSSYVPYSAAAAVAASASPCSNSAGSALLLATTQISRIDDPYTRLADIDVCDPTAQFVHNITADSFETTNQPEQVLQLLDNENLKHRHIELESKMHIQGAQIHAIEGDLDKVPFTTEQLGFQTDLTQLKEQHVKQKKMLMTLQQDHHSLQHCNTTDGCANITSNTTPTHQNVGV
uniref:Methoprene tolerant n=1 Tax=Planococcus kraunhiae TaxID=494597 RepID=A0A146J401_9HEMI|nr:methoprene tolerant [Planococcus kraunhiae]